MSKEDWDIIIKPRHNLLSLNLGELWRYRDLMMLFVRRDFVAEYKQTILGPLWYVIQPMAMSLMWYWALGLKANIGTNGLPKFLFFLGGQALWMYFADCLNKTSDTFIANSKLFGKVYFPRLIVPLSVVISSLIKFSLQFMVFVLGIAYYHFFNAEFEFEFHWGLLMLPIPIFLTAALSFAFGILITAMTTKYRDLKFALKFGVQLLMVGSAVIIPLSAAPVLKWNPIACVMEMFRRIVFGHISLDMFHLIYSTLCLLLVLVLGVLIFNRTEKNFMDTV